MEISFRTSSLRTLCQEHDRAVDLMGGPAAEVLRARIADLRAVTYLAQLPVGRPVVLEAERPQLRFELRAGWSMLMSVGHEQVPRTDGGALDQARVRRALVQGFVHE